MYIVQNFKIKIHMKSLKTILSIFFILLTTTNGFSQTDGKDVSITSSGSGKTQEDAKQAALRSATKQVFGAFISSKTEMFNNTVLADQMASVSNGNIQSYSILNESQFPDGSWGVILKAIVSVDKLTSFIQAKGITVEIKRGIFSSNIKQQLLNEQAEIKAVAEMVGLLHEPMQISFDYAIKSSDPKSDGGGKNFVIPLEVSATTNKIIDFCANYCNKTLAALSLSSEEVKSFQSLGKDVFPVEINYDGVATIFYLRKLRSLDALNTLISNWGFYTRLFNVQTGIDESNGNRLFEVGYGWAREMHTQSGAAERIHDFKKGTDKTVCDSHNISIAIKINFLTAGQQAATFSWDDERSLSQIEQMTGYTVKPRGVVSQFKHGGFVVYEENGHGLIAAIADLEGMDWSSAKTACEELISNGYSDWHLPTKEELSALYVNLKKERVGAFAISSYWSSNAEYIALTEEENSQIWTHDFEYDEQSYAIDKCHNCVRAVRAF
jgi:hypothetical protein